MNEPLGCDERSKGLLEDFQDKELIVFLLMLPSSQTRMTLYRKLRLGR